MQWVLIARSPAAVQSQYSQFTGHCAPRARRPPGVIPAAGGGSRAPVPALSEGAGTAPAGGQWSREAAGSEPAASPSCQPCSSLLLLLELNPIHVSATHSRPSFCSGCPDKRESLPARGARVSNKPVFNSDSAPAAGEPVNRSERKITVRSLLAPCSGDHSRYRAVRVRVPFAREKAARAIFRGAQRVSPFSPPRARFSLFFLTTLRKVISHEAAA